MHEKLGQRGRLEDYNRSLLLNPKYVPALIERSGVFGTLGRWDRAAGDLADVVKLKPGNLRAWTDLAAYRAAMGDAAGYGEAAREIAIRLAATTDPMTAQQGRWRGC